MNKALKRKSYYLKMVIRNVIEIYDTNLGHVKISIT